MDSEELDQLEKGELHIDCVRIAMTGTQNGKPRRYAGAGYIRQIRHDRFEVRILVPEKPDMREILKECFIRDDYVPGVLIPADRYFSLEAFDTRGRRWVCERLMPPSYGKLTVEADGYSVTATTSQLAAEQQRYAGETAATRLAMLAFEKVRYPLHCRQAAVQFHDHVSG